MECRVCGADMKAKDVFSLEVGFENQKNLVEEELLYICPKCNTTYEIVLKYRISREQTTEVISKEWKNKI